MIPARPFSVDLGSGTCGAVAAILDAGILAVCGARPIPVPPCPSPPPSSLLSPVVAVILAAAIAHRADLVVLEIGWLYSTGDSVARALAVARHHEVCAVLAALIAHECERAGIPTVTIARRTWAGRLVPGVRGVSNADAGAAALAGLDAESLAHFEGDAGQHCRDALGALRGWLVGAPAKKAAKGRERAKRVDGGEDGGHRYRPKAGIAPSPLRSLILAALSGGPMAAADVNALSPGVAIVVRLMVRDGLVMQPVKRGAYSLPVTAQATQA